MSMSNPGLSDTELKILNAAKSVFVSKGMGGARMQEIADEAGINKSLLHYYFRSKDKLFEAVFQSVMGEFFPRVAESMLTESSFEDKIRIFVNGYNKVLQQNPYLPAFILSELNRNPDQILQFFRQNFSVLEANIVPALQKTTEELIRKGVIRDIDPRDILVNILGMILFPVVAQPVVMNFLFGSNEEEFSIFMDKRADHISDFVINSIKLS